MERGRTERHFFSLSSSLVSVAGWLCGDVIATMNDEMKIGFIGFGEAGFHIARGCVARAYPASAPTTSTRARRDWARRFGGGPARPKSRLESNAELAAASDVLLSTVTANRSLEAAEQTARFSARGIFTPI